jgi:divalent metal cation (Fe/Co/Zn/Cd) transporter
MKSKGLHDHDFRNLVGGTILLVLGIFVAVYAYNHYPLGTMARIGPAAYPIALGIVLSVLGLAIALPAWGRRSHLPGIATRSAILVLASLLLFGFLLRPTGLVVATFVAVLVSSLADDEATWGFRLAQAAVVCLITVLIFRLGLGMSLPIWWWR